VKLIAKVTIKGKGKNYTFPKEDLFDKSINQIVSEHVKDGIVTDFETVKDNVVVKVGGDEVKTIEIDPTELVTKTVQQITKEQLKLGRKKFEVELVQGK
jgi:hypothetical protein